MEFINFVPDFWSGPRHNRHYFCEALSKHRKVLFVSPPFYIYDLLNKNPKKPMEHSGLTQINPNLYTFVHSKLLFTNYRSKLLNDLFLRLRIKKLLSVIKKLKFSNYSLIIWHPSFVRMLDYFKPKKTIYYVYDQYRGYVGGNLSVQDPKEIELLSKTDITFVLSTELFKDKSRYTKNIHHLANAVDFDSFHKAGGAAAPIPKDISEIPKPRIGYIGTINEKVDLELIEYMTSRRAHWNFVFIGRENFQKTDRKQLFLQLIDKPNFYWLGHKPYNEVPNYINGLDICLMCYIINDWTFYGDPSKMHEYLALGKPVIATGLEAIKVHSNVIDIPEDKKGWLIAIEERLRETSEEIRKTRIKVSSQNSYEARIKKFLSLVDP